MSPELAELVKDAQTRMGKSVESLRQEFTRIRTHRANASLLDKVTVPYYGSLVSLSHAANVSVADASTLMVQPWEKKMVPVIEKAIQSSGLGLNPMTSDNMIRVPIPPLTEDRIKELVRLVRAETENARVAVRNIRRHGVQEVRSTIKNNNLAKDEEKHVGAELQKLTDQSIEAIDKLLTEKESGLTTF